MGRQGIEPGFAIRLVKLAIANTLDRGMRFGVSGNTNARDEARSVAERVRLAGGESRDRFVLFYLALNGIEIKGLIDQRNKWIATSNTAVFVYTGDAEGSQFDGTRLRLWAAIEIDGRGRPATLLKISDGYRGDRRTYADLETEAFDRLKGGRL